MPCASNICTVSDDRHVWYCHGSCGKKFHAACVGAQRNHEQSILEYMLPICNDCQKRFLLEVNFEKFFDQQQESIRLNKLMIESNHKIAANLNKFNINEGFESMETLLNDLKSDFEATTAKISNAAVEIANNSAKVNELTARIQNGKHDDVAIKNHLTSLFDISMQATKNNIMDYVDALTSDLTRELKHICSEFEKVSGLIIDMAGHCTEHNNSQANLISVDIIDELKQLSCAVNSLEIRTTSSPSTAAPSNLGAEMSAKAANESDSSGWRMLGARNVWKASWAEYDARQLRRVEQQKQADKAKKRRKRNAMQKNKNNINKINHRWNNSSNPNIRNQNNCNNYRPAVFNNNNNNRHQKVGKMLPPDKDLLAAAKVTFSNPPVGNLRGIQFRRGEVLNPYPVGNEIPQTSYTSTSNWSCGPAFSQHCSSCSCERSCFRSA